MFDVTTYHGKTQAEIEASLREKGYFPALDMDEPGQEYPPHTHAEHHILVVLDGELEVQVEDDTQTLCAGDAVIILAHVKHATKAGLAGCTYFWVEYKD